MSAPLVMLLPVLQMLRLLLEQLLPLHMLRPTTLLTHSMSVELTAAAATGAAVVTAAATVAEAVAEAVPTAVAAAVIGGVTTVRAQQQQQQQRALCRLCLQ